MRQVALAALALLLVLPPAQALIIGGPQDIVALADRAAEAALEASPVAVPTQPLDLGLEECYSYHSDGLNGFVCPDPDEAVPSLFGGGSPEDNDTAEPLAAEAVNQTAQENATTEQASAPEAQFAAPIPLLPPPRQAPRPLAPSPAPRPADTFGPAPVPAAQRAWQNPLLAWGAAAAAAVVPSLALKLASLLALRRKARAEPALRGELLALLAAEPGLHHTELVRRAGRGNGAVEHHLLALVREGLVQRLRTPGYTCYFPAAHADPRVAAARALVRGRTSRAVVAALAAGGPRSLSGLAAGLGVAVSTAHYHVRRLAAAGLVDARAQGGSHGLALALTDLGRSVAPAPSGTLAGAVAGPAAPSILS